MIACVSCEVSGRLPNMLVLSILPPMDVRGLLFTFGGLSGGCIAGGIELVNMLLRETCCVLCWEASVSKQPAIFPEVSSSIFL